MAAPNWPTPEQLRERLLRRWERQRGDWFGGGGSWPQTFSLGAPSEQRAGSEWTRFQDWLAAWRAAGSDWPIEWRERRWPALGVQILPERLVFTTPDEVAAALGEGDRFRCARERRQQLVAKWPRLQERLSRYFDLLADYSQEDYRRLVDVFAWLCANVGSGLSVRQIPVEGVHSKWIEARQAVLADWLAEQLEVEPADLHRLAGLRVEPERLRLRLLDPCLRDAVGGLGDLTVPVDEVAVLQLPVARVVIVENLQTGLAFEDLNGAVLFMGLGYNVALLGRIPWLRDLPVHYWGDIDTHGFAILHRLRGYLPQAHSLLMDEETLLAHQALVTKETVPARAEELSGLTASEHTFYTALRTGRWGVGVRLEQEFIGWPAAWRRIQALAEADVSESVD